VRTKDEFEGKSNPKFGTLKNAINIPIQVLEEKISTLDQYKDKEIIVYCSHSRRSPRASYILTQHGFSNVTNMAGGMSEMKDKACVRKP
jgi:rhodanese-related sulfurtransferase